MEEPSLEEMLRELARLEVDRRDCEERKPEEAYTAEARRRYPIKIEVNPVFNNYINGKE